MKRYGHKVSCSFSFIIVISNSSNPIFDILREIREIKLKRWHKIHLKEYLWIRD